jgi:hypothetical protein
VIAAISDAEAAVVGSCLVFLLGVAGLYVQNRRGINSQRGDHAATASMVREIHADVREMKADVMDVKAEVRSHGDRLRRLEHMTAVQDHTDRVVADNGRKLQAIQDNQSKEQAS